MLNNALLYMASDVNMSEVCDVAYNSYDEKKTLDYTYFLLQRMEKIFFVGIPLSFHHLNQRWQELVVALSVLQ